MALLPRLLQFAGNLSRGKHARAFEQAARDPEQAQRAVLSRILARNRDTAYAVENFPQARTVEEYSRTAPLLTPAALQPWVKREMAGERNLLTADAPIYYVRTTGSTGEPKHIPITASYREEFQRTVHVSLWHLRRRFPEAFTGRALYFVGSRRVALAGDGNDIGTMSGFNFTEMPKLVRAIYAWPYELFEVKDLPARGFLALLFATIGEPSIIAGIFPAPIVYLLRDLETHLPELARCLRDGKLPEELALTHAQRDLFQRKLGGPRPKLARRLDAAGKLGPGQQVAAAWPQLKLIYCWTTATAGLYLPELQRRAGETIAVRDAIYSACEGWCSIPMGEERPGGALALLSHFFEFIDEAGQIRFAWQLEDGKRYAIVLTTSAGLYRYALGDIVEVCGFHRRAPRIRFVRKQGAASNLAGEKLDESHVNSAVGAALAQTGLAATFFTLAPRLGGERPGYTLYIECESSDLEELRRAVDLALGEASFDYGRLRAGGLLAALALRALPRGTYARIRQSKVLDGSAEAQLKTAHLVADVAALPPELR
jgi:hypothetical protein